MTYFVPGNSTFAINPDFTDSANNITVDDVAAFDLASDVSAALGWVGSVEMPTGVIGDVDIVSLGDSGTGHSLVIKADDEDPSHSYGQLLEDGVQLTATDLTNQVIDDAAYIGYVIVVDREADLLRKLQIDENGIVFEDTTDISGVGAITFDQGITAMESLRGSMIAMLFSKDFDWSEEETRWLTIVQDILNRSTYNGAYQGEVTAPYSRRSRIIEPLYRRKRSAHRSPVSSEQINLENNTRSIDLEKLYSVYSDLNDKLDYQLNSLYKDGIYDIPGLPNSVETIVEQRKKLSDIRKVIRKMK